MVQTNNPEMHNISIHQTRERTVIVREGQMSTAYVCIIMIFLLSLTISQTLDNCIRRGSVTTTYQATNLMTGDLVAIKEIYLGELPTTKSIQLMRMIKPLIQLSHPNITKYQRLTCNGNTICIVLEQVQS